MQRLRLVLFICETASILNHVSLHIEVIEENILLFSSHCISAFGTLSIIKSIKYLVCAARFLFFVQVSACWENAYLILAVEEEGERGRGREG